MLVTLLALVDLVLPWLCCVQYGSYKDEFSES